MAAERTISIRFDGSARGFERAAKRAHRALSDWERATGRTTETLGRAGAQAGMSFFQQLGAQFTKLGSRAFGAGGPLAVLAIPAAAILGTTLGATLAGAMSAAIAGGTVAAGIALAVRDPRIRAEFAMLGDEMLDELTVAASSFIEPVQRAVRRIRETFRSVDFRGMFASASRYVEPLVEGMLGLARNVIPAIRRAIDRAAPVIQAIQRGLPRIGDAIADALDSITGNAGNAAAAIEWVLTVVEAVIRGSGKFIGFLVDAFDWLIKIGEAGTAVGDALFGWIPGVGDQIDASRAKLERYRQTIEGAKNAGEDWRGGTIQLTAAQRLSLDAQEQLWKRTVALNGSMEDAINAAGSLSEAFELLNGGALNAREAEAAYEEAIDEARAAIDRKVKSIDLSTERGRRYDQLLRQQVLTTAQHAQAVYDQTVATKGVSAAQAAATKVYEKGRAELIKTAMQMGLSEEAAIAYADEVMKIPKSWTTTIKAETKGATTAVKNYTDWLKSIPREVKTRMIAEQQSARGGFREFSSGGPVIGRGIKGRDSVPAVLAPGEHVWTHREVQAAGGHAAVAALRKAVLAGVRPAPAPRAAAASSRSGAPIVVERLEVRAYSDRFSLAQVMRDLAMLGVR